MMRKVGRKSWKKQEVRRKHKRKGLRTRGKEYENGQRK